MLVKNALIILLLASQLTACGDKPDREWQLVAQGAYTSALSPQAEYALVGSILHGGSLWRLQDGERLYNWNHAKDSPSDLVASSFSPDSRYAVTAEKKRLVAWQVDNGRPLGFWPAAGGAKAVAIAEQGRYILVGQENYSAILIETATNQIIAKLSHNGDVNTVALSSNGRIAITGAEDGYVRIWDARQEKVLHAFKLGDDIAKVALSHDGRLAFGSPYYGKAQIWNVQSGKLISKIGSSRVTLSAARFSANNKTLLTGDTVRRVIEWRVSNGKKRRSWSVRPPTFYPPSGLIINDVTYDRKKGVYAAFSNGDILYWKHQQKSTQ